VVPRLLGRRGSAVAAIACTLAIAAASLAAAPPASALNTRVSISNFAWSNPAVHVDLDEKVTWDWLGPDLAHSVTGVSPNDLQWDSDPGTDAPDHRPGDSYTVQFDQPGTYLFQCKLHSFVRGEVIVSATPGDPNSDPGPQPPLNIDVKRPTLGGVSLRKRAFNSRKGVTTTASISERGSLDAEYYRFNSKGRRVFNGYATWRTFVGINHFALAGRGKHFKGRPGSYVAILRASDEANNTSKAVKKRFRIFS
jgi:plastocyanin